jgi:hypothetical protein
MRATKEYQMNKKPYMRFKASVEMKLLPFNAVNSEI